MSQSNATRERFVNRRDTTLHLIGGYDCNPSQRQYPDLYVKGGAKINKKLCANSIHVDKDVEICGNLSMKGCIDQDFCVNGNITIQEDIIIDGDQIIEGNIYSDCLYILGNLRTEGIIGDISGNVMGDVMGNIFGGVVGDVTGNVMGDVMGNIYGGVIGNVTGNVIGCVVGDVKGNVMGDVMGNIFGGVVGDVTGNVMGDVMGNIFGGVVGDVDGNVLGMVLGDVKGNVMGDVMGNIFGGVVGDVTGNVMGDVMGNIFGGVVGDINGDVLGNVLGGVSGGVIGDVTGNVLGGVSGGVIGDVDGDVLGNVLGGVSGGVIGDVTGNVLGGVSGGVIGDVTGNVLGGVSGGVIGDVDGDVLGNVLGGVSGGVVGDVTGNVLGGVNGDVSGDVLGNVLGGVNGDVSGDVSGNVLGDILGNVSGDVLGNVLGGVNGDVSGDVLGNVLGDILGNVSGDVLGNVLGDIFGNVNAQSVSISGNLNINNLSANVISSNIITAGSETVLGDLNVTGNIVVGGGGLIANITGSVIKLDPTLMDGFGRQKVSNPYTLIDNKFLTSDQTEFWDTLLANSGTSTHSPGHLSLQVTTTGDRVVRQSRLYTPYQPGKGLTILATGTLEVSGGVTGVTSRIGYFDDENDKVVGDTSGSNGYFYELDGTSLSVVERSDVGGGPVVNLKIPQASWNIDPFDGTGPSGITIDPSKRQIFAIELEWLGVGTAAMGLFVDRQLHFTHIFYHSNRISSLPYISRPTLPVRYEIESSVAAAAGEMVQICSTVLSDGGFQPKGSVYSQGTGGSSVSLGTTEEPIISLRLRSGFRRVALNLLKVTSVAESGGEYQLSMYRYLSPSVDPISGGTWSDVNSTYSAAQINSGATTFNIPLSSAVKLDQLYVSNQERVNLSELSDRFGMVATSGINGESDVLVVTARALTGTVNKVHVSVQWQELE
jgi:hypothetical protein